MRPRIIHAEKVHVDPLKPEQNSNEKSWKDDKQYPPFLLARNKLVSDGTFIIHTREPKFIAEVKTFNSEDEADAYSTALSAITNKTVIRDIIAVVVVLEFWDDIHKFDEKIIYAHTKRLAQWYKAQTLGSK